MGEIWRGFPTIRLVVDVGKEMLNCEDGSSEED